MLKNKLFDKGNSPFLKNLSYLITGTIASQLIGIGLTPVLSRFYSPADFGILGSIVTIAGIIASTGTLRYEMGIVLAKEEEEAEDLVILSSLFLFLLIGLCTITLLFSPGLLNYIGIEHSGSKTTIWICLLAVSLGLRSIQMEWLNRLKKIAFLSKRTVVERLSTNLLQLVWALTIGSGVGLIYGNIAGVTAGIILMLTPLLPKIKELKNRTFDLQQAAKKHYRFAVYSTPQNLLNACSQGLPVFMLGRYFGEAEIGSYFFTMRILQLPSTLVSAAIKRVFYKEAADFQDNFDLLKKKYFKLTGLLFISISLPIVFVFIYGPDLFAFAFGPEWRSAGNYASWMFLWVGLMFVNPPSAVLYYILNKHKIQLIMEVFLFSLRFSALYFGGIKGDMLFTIKIYSIVGAIFNIIFIGYISLILIYGNNNRR